jgi:fused signal recognition particle receptor
MIFWRGKDKTPKKPDPQTEDRPGETWVSRMGLALSKSANKISTDITDLLTKSRLDEDALERLEEILIEADLGPKTAQKIIKEFSAQRFDENAGETEIKTVLAECIERILEPVAKPLIFEMPAPLNPPSHTWEGGQARSDKGGGPFVVLMCGVNGVGKTTTIGKIAKRLKSENKSVMIAAGDTFRAAAVAQLKTWADRAGAEFYAREEGADAASVAFEAYEKARGQNIDVLFIDTAGRLQNKAGLMAELEKIIRVLKKQNGDIPHSVLLALDATTGQNAFEQVRIFREIVNVTGLIVTKLDGTARGGVLVGLADQFGLPVHFIGIGEGVEDLQPFAAADYARALVGI